MSKLRELIIKISANSSSYQSELAKAARLGNDYYKNMGASGRRYQQSLRAQQNALADINEQLSTVTMTAKGMAGAMAGFFSVSALVSTVDSWGQNAARIKSALKSVEGDINKYDEIQKRFLEISNRNGKNIEITQELYIGAAMSMKELGYSSEQTIDYIDSLSSSLTANSTSSLKTDSAINALGKSMLVGKVAGDNFKAVMEAMPSLLSSLAREIEKTNGGIKVTENQVKSMGLKGKISFKMMADAAISSKVANNELADSMDNTVTDGFTRIANSAKKYFGEMNSGIGVTRSMSASLATVSDNFDKIADAGLVLIGVGVTRYLSGLTTSAFAAAGALLNSAKAEVTLAATQVNTTKTTIMEQKAKVASAAAALQHAKSSVAQGAQLERVALAEAKVTAAQNKLNAAIATGTNRSILDAKAKLDKAKASLAAAKATDIEAAAEKRLNAEKAKLASDIANNRDARRNLNRTTSVIGAAGRGLKGIVSLAGGLPGILMLSAGAWYMYKQNQEEAHRASLEYAKTLDDIANRTKKMSLTEASDERGKVTSTLEAQTREIEKQLNTIENYKKRIAIHSGYSVNPTFTSDQQQKQLELVVKLTEELQVEEQRLLEKEKEREKTINVLNGLTDQTAKASHELNTAKNQKIATMARELAQESEFNRILSIGNSILSSRQLLTQAPMSVSAGVRPALLDDTQKQMMLSAEQERILASMTPRDQVRQRSEWDLDKAGFTGDDHKTYRERYISDKLKAHDERERMSKSLKSSNSLMKESERTAERYRDKIADLSVAIAVQKERAEKGEKAAALYAAAHETGAKWTNEQRKSIQSSAVELAKWTEKADEAVRKQREMTDALKDLKEASKKYNDDASLARSTIGMGDRRRGLEEEKQQVERVFRKTDGGAEALKARQDALDALSKKYKEAVLAEADWRAGVTAGLENWVDDASNYAGQAASATQSAMGGMVDNISSMLIGNKAEWKSWSVDVLKSVHKVLTNMALVQTMKAAGGYFGGGFGSFISSIVPNAKGGVYDSPSLSSYSGQIVNSPTMFAFAKGAGLMGEAGPEAIMPLARGSDGSLGVRVLGLENLQNGVTSITSNNAMNIDIGDINLISDGAKEQQQPVGDVSGARQQLKNEIVNTVNEQASREGTPLWLLINRRR